MFSRTEVPVVRTRLLSELTKTIGTALADDRLERDSSLRPAPTQTDERHLARMTAASEIAKRRSISDDAVASTVFTESEEHGIIDEAIARVLGLGRLETLLDDDEISDIHVRGCARVWVKMRDGTRRECDPVVDSDEELVDLIRHAATRLGKTERRFDPANPELNLQLPDGSRLFAAMEISMRPTLIIRRHRFEFSSLKELCSRDMMTTGVRSFLAAAVRARRNIVIAGGTGSGKTTLLRALINEIPRNERLVTIEDAYELGLDRFEHLHPDYDALQARPPNIEGRGEITMADLTKMALRMDPDRVMVGEVRGAEAFPMLMAMSQGNNGSMCTMHADSARSVFPKLVAYVSMASMGIPAETVNLLLASSVHFVVHIEVTDGSRCISSIREVVDADGPTIISNEVFNSAHTSTAFAALRAPTIALLREHGFVDPERDTWSS